MPLAFVAPIVLNAPMVVTVYDLSFLHFPDRLSAARALVSARLHRLDLPPRRAVSWRSVAAPPMT